MYDLIIIGAGPSGVAAAIYAKRSGLNTIIIEKGIIGGLMNYTNLVENYPGFTSITGPELSEKFKEHLESLDIEIKKEEVINLIPGEVKKVITKNNEYTAKCVLVATGRSPKKLGLSGEDKLFGRGISYCALCDAPFYKGKVVAVVGSGNSAFEEGTYLAKFAKEVIVLTRGSSPRADEFLQDKLKEYKNVTIRSNTNIKKINGTDKLESIIINDNEEELKVDGLFIYVGYEPATKFMIDLGVCDERGYILTDDKYETKVDGVFAVGDVEKKNIYQIVTAVSEGATAAVNVYSKISN